MQRDRAPLLHRRRRSTGPLAHKAHVFHAGGLRVYNWRLVARPDTRENRLVRRLFVCGLVFQSLAVGSASASGRLPAVPETFPAPYQGRGLEVRPAGIDYSLTGSLVGRPSYSQRPLVGRLRWRSWTQREARGSGYDQLQEKCHIICKPEDYSFYPARISLFRPRREHGYLVFTRMTIRYTKRVPSDHARKRTLDLAFVNGTFNWGPAF